MGRSLSPILRRELENLDKDADSRKSAMKALKSYVKDLDSKAIPIFLAQVCETKQTGGEHTISLYEVLARVHGPKIVPQINNIMSTIVKTLSSSGGAFALHQACSKVVPAIARYAMDPTTAEDKKRYVIHSLCKPLSDSLLGSQENLSSGSALCLQALVESDNWRFASGEMVNEVCQGVAGALEKHSNTNSHMALVTALAKHNSLIVEAYARLLINSGLQILDAGFLEGNSQKQLSAIHMVTSLMRCLDPKSILSELELVIKEMEKCQSDRMPFVTGAAFEALQIAKRICAGEKSSKFERDITGSTTGSNFSTRRRNGFCRSGDNSPLTASPESQTVDSFLGYDYFLESPNFSMNRGSRGVDYECSRSVNRKLWRGGVDVSLKDGIFSSDGNRGGSEMLSSEYGDDISDNRRDYLENFAGFAQGSEGNGFVRSNTPSPQRSNSRINVDDVKIFTTPRKLIRSLQDLDDSNISGFSEKQSRRCRSPMTSKFTWKPPTSQNGVSQDKNRESVSSTDDVVSSDKDVRAEVVPGKKESVTVQKTHHGSTRKIIACAVFVVLFAVVFGFLAIGGDQDDQHVLIPT